MTPAEFIKQIKILALSYNKEFDKDTIQVWYEYFKNMKKEILEASLKSIIQKSKFIPSISDILEECKLQKDFIRYNIIELMKKDNYFKTIEEYDKANKWLIENIIPIWFIEDMKLYNKKLLENNKLLKGE